MSHQASRPYPSPYRVYNKTPTALMILPRIRDENRHLRVLMEDLLYTTVVDTPPEKPRASLSTVFPLILFITNLILAGQEIGRILAGRATGGRRRSRFLFIKQSYRQPESVITTARFRTLCLRPERAAEWSESDRCASLSNAP